MQDSAPAHLATDIIKELEERGISIIYWPPYSPDLNPIETCWDWIKDYIKDKYGLEENPSYDKLRVYVKEAWGALPDTFLQKQLASIPDRYKAVIAANGMYIKY